MRLRSALVVLVSVMLPPGAGAAPEGEWEVAAGVGGAQLKVDERWSTGWQLGAEAQRGLTELWSLRLALSGSWHPVDNGANRPGGRVQTTVGTVGAVYALDVFRLVPFGELSLSGLDISQAVRTPDVYVGIEAALGVAYHLDPRWSLTASLRYNHFGVPLQSDTRLKQSPIMLGLGIRLCRQL